MEIVIETCVFEWVEKLFLKTKIEFFDISHTMYIGERESGVILDNTFYLLMRELCLRIVPEESSASETNAQYKETEHMSERERQLIEKMKKAEKQIEETKAGPPVKPEDYLGNKILGLVAVGTYTFEQVYNMTMLQFMHALRKYTEIERYELHTMLSPYISSKDNNQENTEKNSNIDYTKTYWNLNSLFKSDNDWKSELDKFNRDKINDDIHYNYMDDRMYEYSKAKWKSDYKWDEELFAYKQGDVDLEDVWKDIEKVKITRENIHIFKDILKEVSVRRKYNFRSPYGGLFYLKEYVLKKGIQLAWFNVRKQFLYKNYIFHII